MRIMQVLPALDVGGIERGVVDLAKYFKDKDDEIIVVSAGGKLVKDLAAYRAKHYRLAVHRKSFLSLFLIGKLRRIIKDEHIDVVHARSRVPAWISFFATRTTNADFITTAHGFYSVHFLSKIMSWGKFVICPSHVIARHMRECFGVSNEKINVISRWVDLDHFRFTPYQERSSKVSIASIGRISPSKGYEYLIEAMRQVVRSNPYVQLHIIGPCDDSKSKYLRHLKNLVHRYSLHYNVRFVGYYKDIEMTLSNVHILVVPSIVEESFGRVAVEAFACGVPVIASRIGALTEIIDDGNDGILVPPKDNKAIAKAILELTANPRFAEQLAIAARKKVEQKYSLTKCMAKVEAVYKQTKTFKRIMVIKISSLGDLILVIPALKRIKEHFPKSHVTLLTLKKYSSLFFDCPFVDNIIGLQEGYKKLRYTVKLAQQIRLAAFDYIIDFQNSRTSQLIAFLSFPRQSLGFARKLGFLLTQRASPPPGAFIDPLTSQETVLELLGIRFKRKKLTFWETKPCDISSLGLGASRFIGINVSASSKWSTKNWPLSHIKKLIETIHKELPGFRAVLIGDMHAQERASFLEDSLKVKVINLCGKTDLRDLIEVLKRMEVFITPDTATLHLAQSLGVEVIALFGPTNPLTHTVKGENLHVIYKKMPCLFCYKPRCKRHKCMVDISPLEIFAQLKTIIRV